MELSDIFGSANVAQFVEEYYHRLPFALQGTAAPLCELITTAILDEMVARPDADVMIVRQGKRYGDDNERLTRGVAQLIEEGYTVLVRHAERHNLALAEIAALFERTFQAPVDIQFYATPRGTFGFSWHYDAEDVFILQASGEKEYLIRKNTVNPWPLEETIPADMQYESELMPLMKAMLHRGDLLYIPCGYWHRGQTTPQSKLAISIAVGVMSRAAITVFDELRDQLIQSLFWRQRLPVTSFLAADDAANRTQQVKDILYHDLTQRLAAQGELHGHAGKL